MKTQNASYVKRIVALLAFLSVTGTVLAGDAVDLGITPDMTARWWQWVFSIPSSVHPLSQKSNDPSGADYCMVGQQGKEWFLGGVFKVVDTSPASSQTRVNTNSIAPIEIVRECHDIPFGKTILIPVLNGECNTAEELALKNVVPEDLLGKTRYLRNCAKTQADAIEESTLSAYFGPVDSRGVWTQNPVEVKRVYTVLPLSLTYSQDNILSSNCGEPSDDDFLCAPSPNPSLTHVDGYWAHVLALKPGKYKLQTYGEVPAFGFALRVTYALTVVGPKDQ